MGGVLHLEYIGKKGLGTCTYDLYHNVYMYGNIWQMSALYREVGD